MYFCLIIHTKLKFICKKKSKIEFISNETIVTQNSRHGVGIAIKKHYKEIFKLISDRFCQLDIELEKNNELTIISAYALTLTKSEKKRN